MLSSGYLMFPKRAIQNLVNKLSHVNKNAVLVSKICIEGTSSCLVVDSPPRTNTLVPIHDMAWPQRAVGDGPIFWNMYHR